MFELNGIKYSNEQLQEAAVKYDMDFDSYLDAMKQKGLTEVDTDNQQEPEIITLEKGERGRAYGSPTAGLETAFIKLKSFAASGIELVDDIIDLAEFGGKMNNPYTRSIYLAQQAALRSSDARAEEKQKIARLMKQNDAFNIVDLDPIAESIRKTLPEYTNDKGEKLDFLGLINEGRLGDAADSFTTEAATVLPSVLISMIPGGYFALGGSSALNKYERDIITRNDQSVSKIVANSIVYGGADAVGEYIGGGYLRGLLSPLKKTGGKIPGRVKDAVIGGVGGIIKTGFKGGSVEFMQEAITSVIQDYGDIGFYGDQKELSNIGRNALHSGLLGFAIGKGTGVVAGTMDKVNRTRFYEYLAPKSYKVNQMELSEAQEKAEQDLENAPKSKKEKFQKVVDNIKAQKNKLQEQLYDRFETMQREDPKEMELLLEKIQEQHEALDIINGGDKYSNEAKDQAKKDFKEAADVVGDLMAVTDINYDSAIELELSKYIRAAEEIDEANKSLWFKSKDLKYEYVDTQEKFDELKKEYGDKIANQADGFFDVTEDGQKKIFINREVAASSSATNVIGHELLHYALSNRFANDPKYLRDSVIAFNQYLDSLPEGKGEYIRKAIEKRLSNPKNGYAKLDANGKVQKDSDGLIVMNDDSYIEEYFTMFSDLIKNEKIDVVEDASKGLANTLRTTIRGLGLGFNNVDFKNGQEVFDFLIDYNKNLGRKGILGAITQRKAIKQAAGKGVKKAEASRKKSVSVERRNQISSSVQEIGSTYSFEGGKKAWDEGGADQAITEIKTNNYLDDLIAAKYKADRVPVDFVDKVYAELTSHIKNFNPETNDNLFGWINSQLANKAGNVYNREYKKQEQEKTAKDVDDRTKEGEVKVQVAAEVDPTLEALETEDISPAAQARKKAEKAKPKVQKESAFRNKIGFKTGSQIYNEILDAAKKSLIRAYGKTQNIKDTAARERAVVEELQKEHNSLTSPLFKQIKNWLGYGKPQEVVAKGTKDIYLDNLREFREDIVKLISTADLVQIERLVAESDRVFTRYKETLTKIADVQKAVDNLQLPPDAINKIKKGQPVRLYEKITPGETEIVDFADQPGSIPSKKDPTKMVRSGLKGTRKDGIAKNIVNGLVFDAAMEARQSEEVQSKAKEMDVDTKSVEQLSAALGRPSNVKFSISMGDMSNIINDIVVDKKKHARNFGKGDRQRRLAVTAIDDIIRNIDNEGVYSSLVPMFEDLKNNINLGLTFDEVINSTWNKHGHLFKDVASYQMNVEMFNGSLNKKHLTNLLGKAKRITEVQVNQIAFNDAIKDLQKNPTDANIKKFLRQYSKQIRTAKFVYNGKTITKNIHVLDNIVKPIQKNNNFGIKTVSEGKQRITFKGEELFTYQNSTEVKEAFKNNDQKAIQKIVETYQKESKEAIDFVEATLKSDKSIEVKKAIIKSFFADTDAGGRKIAKPGIMTFGISKTVLDHRVPINKVIQEIYKTADNPTSQNLKNLREFLENTRVNNIPKTVDTKLVELGFKTEGDMDVMNSPEVLELMKNVNVETYNNVKFSRSQEQQTIASAVKSSRSSNNPTKGITVLDFDDTLATTESLVKFTRPDGTTGTLNAEQYASTYESLLDQGYTFDFSEFNKVVKGKIAPLFQKALKLQGKFGPENMFVLTARPPQAQKAIFDFLKANGLNIPLENITGLGNSTAEAKALWMADKVGEGYNDFYFADDALQNVQAVDNVLSQFDVKRKIQQAKVKFSKGTLSTKQDLNWKEDNIGYMTTNFDVDGNNYKITLYPTDLNDTNYELEFDLVTEKGLTQEMTGTGNQFKVLGIVYNGLLDVVKQKPNIETIGFSALTKDKSRARVYTILMDKLGKKLGWKTDIYEYGSRTQLDFEVAKPKTRKARTKTTESIRNIPAVKNILNQSDVKSPTQQAKVKFSKSMNDDFNNILEEVTDIEAKKRFSEAKARKRGSGKGRFRVFVPPSHEDFVGLLYNFIGKGEQGNQHRDFFEQALVKPLNRAYRELNMAKQAIANDYKKLTKQMPDIRKKLTKQTPDGDFTYDDAVRVYLWDKFGFEIPGLTKTDTKKLVDYVNLDGKLKTFADAVGQISKMDDGYIEPGEHWLTGSIRQDLVDATGRVGRAKFFTEFIENADIIFSQENINKIRAAYGDNFTEALQDMLSRIKTGTNRKQGGNRQVNAFLDYLNGSIGATMFFNARSAVLQTLSTVNFINYGDNNIFKAAARFADQKQFWSDFAKLFNSDFLKQRRAGVGFDVNGAEIASAVKKAKNPIKATIAYILNKGFLPTQMADSFAIALGGSSMYRNRVNTYVKQGLAQSEAETKAFNDFMETAEATQQSARPDMISQQQASVLGRMILAFQNVTSQYTRLIKKAGLDLINRRKTPPYNTQVQSDMSNISKIIYYGAIQNVIFYGLQSALFAMAFEDDEDEDKKNEKFFKTKKERLINGSIDSILRGSGVGGAIISVLKNAVIKYGQQQEKGWGKQLGVISDELLQLSPPVGIKLRKIDSFEKTMEFNKKVIPEMDTFDLDNPIWDAYGNLTEGLTNIPVARLIRKVENVRSAIDSENAWWQRLALGLGWSKWELGIEDKEINEVKKQINKSNKSVNSKKFKKIKFK